MLLLNFDLKPKTKNHETLKIDNPDCHEQLPGQLAPPFL